MKIISLCAENVKKLTLVEISPTGNLVQITGKNGQGKTSVLDAIWLALDNAAASGKTSQPIRRGADKARIELKLGRDATVQLVVERRFTEKASYLEVRTVDGARYSKPQNFLDDLLGALTFDPLEFMRDRKGQFDVLKNLVALDMDLDAAATADKFDYQERTRVNREAKARRAQAVGIAIPENVPAEPIDEDELLDQYERANAHNIAVDQQSYLRRRMVATAAQNRVDALKLRANAANLIREAEELEAGADTNDKEVAAAVVLEPIDLAAIRGKLDWAKLTNSYFVDRHRRNALEIEAVEFEKKSDELTAAIDAREVQRVAAIAAAKMPVPGLGFGDGVVLFDGLPLDQASDAEQLMISTAIAAALNPKLRVLRIRDGSLLDDDAMLRLAKFADERDFQIWIERVDGSGTVGIVMEDGHVRGREFVAK